MKYSHSQKQKIEWWLSMARDREKMGSCCFNGYKFQLYKLDEFWELAVQLVAPITSNTIVA